MTCADTIMQIGSDAAVKNSEETIMKNMTLKEISIACKRYLLRR